MTSFYYYDQNPSGFCFLVQIRAFVIQTSLGLQNLNMKGKTKRILVVVVKWRHHAKDLILIRILHGFSHVSSHVLECVHASVPGCSNNESILQRKNIKKPNGNICWILDRYLSIGWRHPPFTQRGPVLYSVPVCCDMVTLIRAINFLFAFIN